MPCATVGSVGYEMTLTVGGVTVGKAQDVEPTFEADEVDVSTRSSGAFDEYRPGRKRGTFTAQQLWIATDTGLQAVIDAYFQSTVVDVELLDANGNGFTGCAFITSLGRSEPQKDAVVVPATFRFTGTITPVGSIS